MLLRVCANQSLATCRRHGKILFQKSRFSTTRHNNSTPGFKHRNFSTTSSTKKPFYEAYFVGVGVTLVAGYAWNIIVPSSFPIRTQCELQAMAPVPEKQTISVKVVDEKTLWQKGKRALLIVRRMIKLMIVLSPLAALYPLQFLLHSPHSEDEDAQDIVLAALKQKNLPDGIIGWYYKLCLFCVEWSGAAAIKIMQWAGSRPDMFGPVFCAVFSQLQDDTTPHAWNHTEKALQESFGENWQEHIRLGGILGSGCIAQVYKGVVFVKDGTEQEVAVKVMHPHVDDDIDADLDIMRLSVRFLEKLPFDVFRNIKWLNLDGFIDEMDKMLNIQLDLRTEADHLVRFNENFKNNENVIFPKVRE